MILNDGIVWIVLIGLSLVIVGGLMLWAYGLHRRLQDDELPTIAGPEATATRAFHTRLVSWFFWYGLIAVLIGLGLVVWMRIVMG